MANCCPSVSSQGWNHAAHDKCLGTPLTEGTSAKWAAQEEHPALTTSHALPMWSGSIKEHPLHPLSSQQYQFYRTEDLVWQLLYFGLYQTLLSCDRRQSTPACKHRSLSFHSTVPSQESIWAHFILSIWAALLAHKNNELTVPLIYALYILNVQLKGLFFFN